MGELGVPPHFYEETSADHSTKNPSVCRKKSWGPPISWFRHVLWPLTGVSPIFRTFASLFNHRKSKCLTLPKWNYNIWSAAKYPLITVETYRHKWYTLCQWNMAMANPLYMGVVQNTFSRTALNRSANRVATAVPQWAIAEGFVLRWSDHIHKI